jgi:hypothetical protein
VAAGTSHVPSALRQSVFVSIVYRITGSVILHLPKLPLKNPTPRIAKIKRKSRQTIVTLLIAGNEESKALTINFIPLFLDTILRGRRARRARSALRD